MAHYVLSLNATNPREYSGSLACLVHIMKHHKAILACYQGI